MASRWHELFDQFTPDTFHPKLFSLPTLISEAVTIGQLQSQNEAWGKHLRHVQEEIGDRLNTGFERNLCSARHIGMLQRIQKSESASEVIGIGRVLDLEDFSASQERSICHEFQTFDLSKVSLQKSSVDSILTSLATLAFRKGCTSDDSKDIDSVIPQGSDKIRHWILSSIPSCETEFDCIIAVEAPDNAAFTAIKAVCTNAHVSHTSPKLPGLTNVDDRIFLRRITLGLRAAEAIESFKNDIRAKLNLLALYNQNLAPAICPVAWIFERGRAEIVTQRSTSLYNLHARKEAIPLARKAAKALIAPRDEPAIRAALDLHNLALSMSDHRLRLVNLWSALECLASLVEGNSIISKVERLVVPILKWRKIDTIVRYIAISIHFWLKDNPEIDHKHSPIRLGYNDYVNPESVLKLLTAKKDTPEIRSLLNLVSGHTLLLYRTNEAWNVFHDPKKLHANMKQSGLSLRRHLWRIYRARNLLVHQGIEPPCLPQLANHLQQYFSWTLSRLIHGLTLGERWTGCDSWHYWKSKSEHVMNSLDEDYLSLTLGDMFPEKLQSPHISVWDS